MFLTRVSVAALPASPRVVLLIWLIESLGGSLVFGTAIIIFASVAPQDVGAVSKVPSNWPIRIAKCRVNIMNVKKFQVCSILEFVLSPLGL